MTTSAANIMSLPEQAFFVFIKENDRDNIGVAGMLLADRDEQNSPVSERPQHTNELERS
ncbi:hypothetical protein D1872_304660 [compost metagenome]